VGVGNITGPYRGYLYYWKTTRKGCIDDVAEMLWPFLSAAKRLQLQSTAAAIGRTYSGLLTTRDAATEGAWAAGLFDGEGSLWLAKDERNRPEWRGVSMELAQASQTGVPETLERFQAAVRVGHIAGPRRLKNSWTRLPQYRWQVSGRHAVSAAIDVLWPSLSPMKRGQIRAMSAYLDGDWVDATEGGADGGRRTR
jgi:hypothetical protein